MISLGIFTLSQDTCVIFLKQCKIQNHATVLTIIYIFLHSPFKKFNNPCGLYHKLGFCGTMNNNNFRHFVSVQVTFGVEKPCCIERGTLFYSTIYPWWVVVVTATGTWNLNMFVCTHACLHHQALSRVQYLSFTVHHNIKLNQIKMVLFYLTCAKVHVFPIIH